MKTQVTQKAERSQATAAACSCLDFPVVRQPVLQLRLRLRCETHLGRHKKAPQRMIKEAARPGGAGGAQGWPQAADMIHSWRDTAPLQDVGIGCSTANQSESGES